MKLQPRHFVLFALLAGLVVFNIVRTRTHQAGHLTESRMTLTATAPIAQTPAWSAFDKTSALRDAADPAFDPAMQSLQQLLGSSRDSADTGLHGCVTWLEFYRQGVHHPASDPQWKQRSQHHLDGCAKYHQDTTAS